MGTSYKTRGTYGLILLRKIRKWEKIFNRIYNTALDENKELDLTKLDVPILINLSKAMDYTIQTQLSNIHAIEEFEILEKTEKEDAGHRDRQLLQETQIQAERKF